MKHSAARTAVTESTREESPATMFPISTIAPSPSMHHPLTDAALALQTNAFSQTPYLPSRTVSGHTPGWGTTLAKSLFQGLIAYYPVKWLTQRMGLRAPGLITIMAGLFGFHAIRKLMAPKHALATAPVHHLNLAA